MAADNDQLHCPECRYPVARLDDARCPECGTECECTSRGTPRQGLPLIAMALLAWCLTCSAVLVAVRASRLHANREMDALVWAMTSRINGAPRPSPSMPIGEVALQYLWEMRIDLLVALAAAGAGVWLVARWVYRLDTRDPGFQFVLLVAGPLLVLARVAYLVVHAQI